MENSLLCHHYSIEQLLVLYEQKEKAKQALECLIVKLRKRMIGLSIAILKNKHDAEDCTSAVTEKILKWGEKNTLDLENGLQSVLDFFFKATTRKAIDIKNKRNKVFYIDVNEYQSLDVTPINMTSNIEDYLLKLTKQEIEDAIQLFSDEDNLREKAAEILFNFTGKNLDKEVRVQIKNKYDLSEDQLERLITFVKKEFRRNYFFIKNKNN